MLFQGRFGCVKLGYVGLGYENVLNFYKNIHNQLWGPASNYKPNSHEITNSKQPKDATLYLVLEIYKLCEGFFWYKLNFITHLNRRTYYGTYLFTIATEQKYIRVLLRNN